ncbi:MAG: cyclodeaminase/cyclohydrolase family protein, partial [Chitinophagales bacterium]
IIEAMVKTGNPNSVTDAGVGALAVRSAVLGAYLNVKVNAKDLKDEILKAAFIQRAEELKEKAVIREKEIFEIVEGIIKN